jgi:hypothetical protein
VVLDDRREIRIGPAELTHRGGEGAFVEHGATLLDRVGYGLGRCAASAHLSHTATRA